MPTKSHYRSATHKFHLWLDSDTHADLAALCELEAARTGASPDRLASSVMRGLIRAARRAARPDPEMRSE